MLWYKKLSSDEQNTLRRNNYKLLRLNGCSVKIAIKVRNWRKYHVKKYIKNVIQ